VAYGEHPDQVADVRLPGGPARGTVLFLHGGFWRAAFDRLHVAPLAVALAAAGFVAITPEYRRTGSPGGGWPGTFDDVAAAVRTAPALVGAGPLVLAGHSAGGQLALWAAHHLATAGRPPRGVVALAPVADLTAAYHLDLGRGAVATLLGGAPTEEPARYAAADPMTLLPLGVETVLGHGDRDAHVPVAFSRDYAVAARLAGDRVTLREWPGVEHFAPIDPESTVWPEILAAIERLMAG
jgi:acetyl esterase/lipase